MNEVSAVIVKRLDEYSIKTRIDGIHATREITQQLVLAALSQTSFFDHALFHGGTSLRILWGINRYSEDLDFSLIRPDSNFHWMPFLEQIQEQVNIYGCSLEIEDKSKLDAAVKKAFIKDSSIGQMLDFSWVRKSGTWEKVKIKLEIDTNPPAGGKTITKQLDFPFPHIIRAHDLPSMFAGKCHALLCRQYEKGRDWYDFLWYIEKRIEPDYEYLSTMINQAGPWAGQNSEISRTWLENALVEKINTLDFNNILNDIYRFVNASEQNILKVDKQTLLTAVDTFSGFATRQWLMRFFVPEVFR
jgi:predicted nucleotidyltransferase component of viral defense system